MVEILALVEVVECDADIAGNDPDQATDGKVDKLVSVVNGCGRFVVIEVTELETTMVEIAWEKVVSVLLDDRYTVAGAVGIEPPD